MDTKDKVCLVRSSSRILGPYSFSNAFELLKENKISIVDEVCDPCGRWVFIREDKRFAQIIQNLKEKNKNFGEHTVTNSITENLNANTVTVTEASFFSDDATPSPISPPPVNSVETMKTVKSLKSSEGISSNHLFTGKKKSYLSPKKIISLLIIFISVVVLFIQYNKNKISSENVSDLLLQSQKYFNFGLYSKSYSFYQKAKMAQPIPKSFAVELASLNLAVGRNYSEVRKLLEEAVLDSTYDHKQIADFYNLLGLSYMLEPNSDNGLKNAESLLLKGLGFNQNNISIYINLAVNYLKQNKFAQSREMIEKGIAKDAQNSYLYLLLAQITLAGESATQGNLISTEMNKLEKVLKSKSFLSTEIGVLFTILANVSGDGRSFELGMEFIFNQIPNFSDDFIKNLKVDWSLSDWEHLFPICDAYTKDKNQKVQLRQLKLFCMTEAKKTMRVQNEIQDLSNQMTDVELFKVNKARYNSMSGNFKELSGVLKSGLKENFTFISQYFKIQLCLHADDYNCMNKAIFQLKPTEREHVYINYVLALLENSRKNRTKAFEYINRGLQMSDQYYPLVELRDQIESSSL